eukprot:828-Heterococcus_DN1.PRE.4
MLCYTGLLVFIAPGTAAQSATACTLAFVTILIYGLAHPHASYSDTVAYTLAAAIIFVTTFVSLLTQAQYTDHYSERIISVLLIVLNVILAAISVVKGMHAGHSGNTVEETFAPICEVSKRKLQAPTNGLEDLTH